MERKPTLQENKLIYRMADDIYEIADQIHLSHQLIPRNELRVLISDKYGEPDVSGICGYTKWDGHICVHPKILIWDISFAVFVLSHEMVHARQYQSIRGIIWARTLGRWRAEKEANHVCQEIQKTWQNSRYILRYGFGYNL